MDCPGTGWVTKICLCGFGGVIPYGEEKTHTQNPQKIPGQSREKLVYVFFFCSFVFRSRLIFKYGTELGPFELRLETASWGVVLPTFRRSRNSCVFVLHDLFKAEKRYFPPFGDFCCLFSRWNVFWKTLDLTNVLCLGFFRKKQQIKPQYKNIRGGLDGPNKNMFDKPIGSNNIERWQNKYPTKQQRLDQNDNNWLDSCEAD